jgi:hypothetical protein
MHTIAPHNGTDTSIAAAQDIEPHLDRLCAVVYEAIKSRGMDGATREELESLTDLPGNTVRPRCKRLLFLGLVTPCPHGQVRRTASGRAAEVLVCAS